MNIINSTQAFQYVISPISLVSQITSIYNQYKISLYWRVKDDKKTVRMRKK